MEFWGELWAQWKVTISYAKLWLLESFSFPAPTAHHCPKAGMVILESNLAVFNIVNPPPKTAPKLTKIILLPFTAQYIPEYLGPLMQRPHSLEKTLMLGKIESRKRRGRQRMRWLDSITDLTNMSLSNLQEMGTGKPGVLQSMGSQRVGHNWATEQQHPRYIKVLPSCSLSLDVHAKVAFYPFSFNTLTSDPNLQNCLSEWEVIVTLEPTTPSCSVFYCPLPQTAVGRT